MQIAVAMQSNISVSTAIEKILLQKCVTHASGEPEEIEIQQRLDKLVLIRFLNKALRASALYKQSKKYKD